MFGEILMGQQKLRDGAAARVESLGPLTHQLDLAGRGRGLAFRHGRGLAAQPRTAGRDRAGSHQHDLAAGAD